MASQTIGIGNATLTIGGSTVGLAEEIDITIDTKVAPVQGLGATFTQYQVEISRAVTVNIKKLHINDTYIDLMYPSSYPDYSTSSAIVLTCSNQTSGGVAQTTTHTITGKIVQAKLSGGKGAAFAEDIVIECTAYSVATA